MNKRRQSAIIHRSVRAVHFDATLCNQHENRPHQQHPCMSYGMSIIRQRCPRPQSPNVTQHNTTPWGTQNVSFNGSDTALPINSRADELQNRPLSSPSLNVCHDTAANQRSSTQTLPFKNVGCRPERNRINQPPTARTKIFHSTGGTPTVQRPPVRPMLRTANTRGTRQHSKLFTAASTGCRALPAPRPSPSRSRTPSPHQQQSGKGGTEGATA